LSHQFFFILRTEDFDNIPKIAENSYEKMPHFNPQMKETM